MTVEIGYLADHPALIEHLADWFYTEWGAGNPALTPARIAQRMQERLHRDRLPMTLVAFHAGQPVASASLKIRELETHPQFEHWLGNVYVLPAYRRQGIGTHLIQFAASEARRLGVPALYLYTRDRARLYERLGWRAIERRLYHGRAVVILRRELE